MCVETFASGRHRAYPPLDAPHSTADFPALLGGLVLMAAALVATVLSSPPQQLQTRPVFVRSCIGDRKHPTNAGKVFRWGHEAWRQEFETVSFSNTGSRTTVGSLQSRRECSTIRAGRHTGTVKAWPNNQAARTGRGRLHPPLRALALGARYEFMEPSRRYGTYCCGANRHRAGEVQAGDKRVTAASVPRCVPPSPTCAPATWRSRAWHTNAAEITDADIRGLWTRVGAHGDRRRPLASATARSW